MQYPSLSKFARFTVAIIPFCMFVPSLSAQTSDAQAGESQSWTKTTESHTANTNPTRTTESHKQSAKGTVDNQTVERLAADGHYEPYYDIEVTIHAPGGSARRNDRQPSSVGSPCSVVS